MRHIYLIEGASHVVDMGQIVADKIAAHIGEILAGQKIGISTAESFTGGGVSAVMMSVANSSEWFDRGFVIGSDEAARKMLSVKVPTLKKYGAISQAVVEEMVKGAIKKSNATLSVAISRMTGPEDVSEERPLGTVWIAWAVKDCIESTKVMIPGDSREVRNGVILVALQGLLVRAIEWKEKNKKNALDVGEVETPVQ